MIRKHRDIFTGLFFLAFSIVMYISTFSIVGLTEAQIGADFMPRLVSIAIAITSISIIVSGFRKGTESAATAELERENNSEDSEQIELVEIEENEDSKQERGYLSVVLAAVLMIVYLISIPLLGFLLASIVYLSLQMLMFSDWNVKKIPMYLTVSIVTSAFVYYVFRYLFYVMLPVGILG